MSTALALATGAPDTARFDLNGWDGGEDVNIVETFTSADTIRRPESDKYAQIFKDLMAESLTSSPP
jgi:hypothetical protein